MGCRSPRSKSGRCTQRPLYQHFVIPWPATDGYRSVPADFDRTRHAPFRARSRCAWTAQRGRPRPPQSRPHRCAVGASAEPGPLRPPGLLFAAWSTQHRPGASHNRGRASPLTSCSSARRVAPAARWGDLTHEVSAPGGTLPCVVIGAHRNRYATRLAPVPAHDSGDPPSGFPSPGESRRSHSVRQHLVITGGNDE